jgi:LysR family cyn operon transcriptional activator
MELRQLRYLLAVAEEGHMGRAAARVHITQPGLSQQLRKLEDELGVSLIERHNKGVRLSVAGAALLPFIRNALRQIRDGRQALADLNQLTQGSVTVGSLQAPNVGLLPKAVARLTHAHPDVRVQAQEMAAQEIELGVLEGLLDLGIGFIPVAHSPESYETELLFEEELVLVVRREHTLARQARLRLNQLDDVPLALLPARFQIRRILDDVTMAEALTLAPVVEMDTVHSLLAVVREADLATVLPAMALPKESSDFKCLRLTEPTPSCSVGLIWRQNGFRNSASRALAAELRTLAKDYDSGAVCWCRQTASS